MPSKVSVRSIGATRFAVTDQLLAKAHNAAAALTVGQHQTKSIGGAGDDVEAAGRKGLKPADPRRFLLPSFEPVGVMLECGEGKIPKLAGGGKMLGDRSRGVGSDVRKMFRDSVPKRP